MPFFQRKMPSVSVKVILSDRKEILNWQIHPAKVQACAWQRKWNFSNRWLRILIRFEVEILRFQRTRKCCLFVEISQLFLLCHAINFARDKEKWNFLNRWLRVIPHNNPVRSWNFVSQTDGIEQEKDVFSSGFLNSFVSVTQSILRVTKKMKFFKSLVTCDPT